MKKSLSGVLLSVFSMLISGILTSCAPNHALTRDQLMGNKKQANSVNEKEYIYTYDDRDKRGDLYSDTVEKPARNQQKERDNKKNEEIYSYEDSKEMPSKKQYFQTGMASWYGREFHGKMTASGERFNMNELTAAHRTLPFGTVVEIKNLDNGKTVRVKVNDRGPYKKNRIIDLSYAAARHLDILADGEAMVGIAIIGKERGAEGGRKVRSDKVEPVSGFKINENEDETLRDGDKISESHSRGNYALQAGAFYSKKKAENLGKRIEEIAGKPVVIIREELMYKLRVEGIGSKSEASRLKKALKKENINSFIRDSKE